MNRDFQAGGPADIRSVFWRLDELGVEEYVVCAGARNAALVAVAVARAQEEGGVRLAHFFDERSAAFFALGRVMASGRPVAVFTTSGTAAAELLPTMVEAHYQGLRLVAVTADRPLRFAGSGAPQAIEQEGIFGIYANGSPQGPLHLNVRLEEGLPGDEEMAGLAKRQMRLPMPAANGELERMEEDEGEMFSQRFWRASVPMVVLAAGIPPREVAGVAEFLLRLGAPVMAEATANLEGWPGMEKLLLRGGEKTLHALNAGRVLRIGATPSWRWWRDLEHREDVAVLNVSQSGFSGMARKVRVGLAPWSMLAEGQASEGRGDHGRAVAFGAGMEVALMRLLARFPNSEPAWMRHVAELIGPGARVFLGNSLPVREWNLAAGDVGKGMQFFANRGANGIDGLVSTWLGVGAEGGESWLVVGDLSALYDLNAPWILPQLGVGKRRLVVINNGGGQIFSRVGWLKKLSVEARQVVLNPHALRFESWAGMWGMNYRCFDEWRCLADDDAAATVWEIRPDAEETRAFWEAWEAVVES